MHPVRALAAAAVGAALLAGCTRTVDVAPSSTAEPAVTSTVAPSGTASASSRTSPHRTDLPRTLRVAVSFDQPGIGLRQGNSYTGLDVAVAEHIARYLGIPRISFVEAVTDQRRTLLATGQVDLVLAAYSMTPERADDAHRLARLQRGDGPRAGPVGRHDDLRRRPVGAGGAHPVDREAAAQEHRARAVADGEGDELPRPGDLGQARGDEGQVPVGTRSGVAEDLGVDLDDAGPLTGGDGPRRHRPTP